MERASIMGTKTQTEWRNPLKMYKYLNKKNKSIDFKNEKNPVGSPGKCMDP
jgi:hypothetical protein